MKKAKYISNCTLRLLMCTLFFSDLLEATEQQTESTTEESDQEPAEGEVFEVTDLSDDDDALYEAIFGTVAQDKDILLDYDVMIDGEKVGSAPVFSGKNNRIQAAALKNLLIPFLESSDIAPIDKRIDKEGFISFEDLSKISLKTRINKLTMTVEVSLPVEKKKIRTLGSFSKHREIPNAFPANVSGFCNIRASKTFNHEKVNKESKSYSTTNLVLNHALNLWGFCVEGQNSYAKTSNSTEKGKFKRDYTTFVYDMPNRDMTFKYGDVFSRSLSYQSAPHVWGFNFNKGVDLISREGWDRNIQITLLKKSTIEVYSNGNLIRTQTNVAPGTYVFDDISFHNGENDIKIKIIDETGREEILDESRFYESSFVPQGEFSTNITYGYPQVNKQDVGRYDKKHPVFSGNIRYGLTSALEIGGGILKNNIGHTASYEIKNKNLLGSFGFKFANSTYKKDSKNIRGKVFYASYNAPSIKFDSVSAGFSASYENSDNFFKPYLAAETETKSKTSALSNILKQEKNEEGKNKSISYGIWFNNVFSMNFHFNNSRRKRYDGAKSRHFSFSVSKSLDFHNDWFNSGSISASFERERDYEGKPRRAFSIYCSILLGNRVSVSSGMSKTTSSDGSKTESVRSRYMTMSYYPENTRWGGEISTTKTGPMSTWSGHANYTHPVFKGNVTHSRNNNGSNSTTVGVETGIFFADTRYGIARPIDSDGGFVIATPRKALSDTTLKFASQDIESGFLGGGAVLQNSRNSASTARLDLKDLPMGLDIKKDTIVSYGEYKRGFVADIEAEGSYTADGYLFDSEGDAFKHATGYAIHTTDLSTHPIAFFTNDEGRFILTELKQGTYKISLNVEGVEDFEIKIGETNDEIIHLGKFTCKESTTD